MSEKVLETETIDRLFLELSQVTNATTQKELSLRTALTARESELAEAQRRVAELEKAVAMNTAGLLRGRIDRYKMTLNQIARSGGSRDFFMEEQVEKMEKELAALLPPDRIAHIPGKESDDGKMH